MPKRLIGLLIIILVLIVSGMLFLNERRNSTCNTLVTLAPGKTMDDVCSWWADQPLGYREANRYCGCGPYK